MWLAGPSKYESAILNFYSMIDLPSIQGPQYLPVCTASRFDVALLARVLPML
jgi:hypothetical protein